MLLAVTVLFDKYYGPSNSVPVTTIRHAWLSSVVQCSCLQLSLELAWPVTIHISKRLTLNKLVTDTVSYSYKWLSTSNDVMLVFHLNGFQPYKLGNHQRSKKTILL